MSKSIEELDPNFQAAEVDSGLRWQDARELTLEGVGWRDDSEAFCRLPDRANGVVREDVWILSRHSAGVRVRFITDAPAISARWVLREETLGMPHMPATGVSGLDLYARDESRNNAWRWCGMGVPSARENEAVLLEGTPDAEREYSLYLPLYNGTKSLQIGVPQNAKLQPAESNKKPICFYGTSITQGGCAARPGMAYPAIVSRWLDSPHWNFGFSGNGKADAEVASLLAELDPSVYVLDCLPNMDAELISERMENFIQTLRRARPSTPIVLVENISYQHAWLIAGLEYRSRAHNAALQPIYQKLLNEGMGDLHYVAGNTLLGDDSEGTVDGGHPTDLGFLRMAEVLLPHLRGVLEPAA